MESRSDKIFKGLMLISTFITVSILVLIIGYVFVKGIGKIDLEFFTNSFDEEVFTVEFNADGETGLDLGLVKIDNNEYLEVQSISENSTFKTGISDGELFEVKEGDVISGKISTDDGRIKMYNITVEEGYDILNNLNGSVDIKFNRPGGGIFELIISTFYMIGLSLLISLPISIASGIYLTEYAKKGRLLNLIRFATECLAGVPSIIFGLFGMLLFVGVLKMGYSLMAGACTMSIILLPTLIRQTEEALIRVPNSYRQGALSLGASKLHTIATVVLPNALEGIFIGVLLSIGRIMGESAALLLTAGTIASIPSSVFNSSATITVKAYLIAKETGDIEMACAMGLVVIFIVIIINMSIKMIEKIDKKRKFG